LPFLKDSKEITLNNKFDYKFETMNGFGVLVFTPADLQWPPDFQGLDFRWLNFPGKVTRHGA
jgi:hypothetical protein